MNFRGGGATCNQAPASVLAESNVIKRHPEPKAKDSNKKHVDSSVALLLQNDVQGAGKFFWLCAQNDKAAQGDSSGIRPQNDMTHCDEPIRSDLSDENTQNPKCRDSEVNNNCRQGKRQRRVLSERSEFTRPNAESSKLLANEACGWFASLCHQSDRRPRRTKQKPEVDSSVASLLQNDVQGAWEFFGLCAQNDKAEREDSSGFSPQNDIKKDVILSQRRRIHLKRNWIFHSVQNDRKKSKHAAFTMAEVLITLGIIGIVAAMTMPALIANHRKQVMLSKVKHTYNIIANAFERAKVDHGTNINYWYIPDTGSQLEKSIFFVENYLLPYLNAPIYCADKPTAPYCFYQVGYFSGDSFFNWGPADNNSGTALLLSSGVTVSVTVGELATLDPDDPLNESINRIRILFDIDGPKGYNRYGYDVFWLELGGAEGRLEGNNADKNKILPYGYDLAKSCDYYVSNINYACRPDVQYSGGYCLAYIVCNGWDAGKKYPW